MAGGSRGAALFEQLLVCVGAAVSLLQGYETLLWQVWCRTGQEKCCVGGSVSFID